MNEQAEQWMDLALEQARVALGMDEVPIGCVIVHNPTGKIIGQAPNRRETDHDPTAHAEILAMRQAGAALGHWRLVDCTVIVTLEPCPMCAGAMVNARVSQLIYGCDDPKAGAVRTLYNMCDDPRLNHRMQVTGGVKATECGQMLQEFFRVRRGK
ncbi:MAG TPA: tRNA adenosine(34) deaminase TadA [Tepidisphaeraceae bacterium]